MSKVTVTRGHITVPARGIKQVFMFNPESINDDKQIEWGTLSRPGASHPVFQFGSGGERTISFTIYLDGDRGRFDRNINEARNLGIRAADQESTLSVRRVIEFYQSLLYPSNVLGTTMRASYPYVCLFSFGPMYDSVPVVVKRAPVSIDYWTPKLEPVRATIDLQLSEVPLEDQSASNKYSDYDFG